MLPRLLFGLHQLLPKARPFCHVMTLSQASNQLRHIFPPYLRWFQEVYLSITPGVHLIYSRNHRVFPISSHPMPHPSLNIP